MMDRVTDPVFKRITRDCLILLLAIAIALSGFSQITTGTSGAQLDILVLEDQYPNLDDQNYLPLAVNNVHRFRFGLENEGEIDEEYTLKARFISASDDWTADLLVLSEQSVPLDRGELREVWMEVTAPSTAKLGDQAEIDLLATGADSAAEFSLTVSVAVRNWTAYIDGLATFEQGDSNEYDLTIVNLNDTAPFEASKFPIDILYPGSLPDWKVSFDPGDGSDPSSWPQSATHSSDIPAGATITVPFRLTLNDNVKASDDTTFLLQANNNDGEHNTNYYMVEGHAAVLPYHAIYVSVDGSSIAEVDDTGGTATFDLTVENYGNDDDSFTIAMTEDLPNANWEASIDKASTAVLPWKGDGGLETFTVTLEAPASQLAGSEGTATATITSDSDGAVTTSRTLTLRVTRVYAISLTGPAEKTQYILPGATGEFSLQVNNDGNGPDTVALTITGDPQWIGDPAFTYASAGVTEIEVDAASSEVVLVNVMVPAGASHNDEQSITITATSEDGETEASMLFRVMTAQVHGVAVTNSTNVTWAEMDPGQTTTFGVLVSNTGNGLDTVTLTVDGRQELECRIKDGSRSVAALNLDGGDSRVLSLEVTALSGPMEGSSTLVDHILTVRAASGGPGGLTSTTNFTVQVREYTPAPPPPPQPPGPSNGLPGGLTLALLALAGVVVIGAVMGLRRYRG